MGIVALAAAFTLSTSASAAIVCNNDGDCWRVKERHTYTPDVQLHVYDDDWVIDTNKYKWREVGKGRGYWRGSVWINF
jgi:hypothetical protein